MRSTLRNMFGDRSNNVLIIHEDGKDWALVRHICDLMQIRSEYKAVQDHVICTEFNLTDEEKRKFTVPNVHMNCPVWFVSITGFWKIVGRTRTPWALKFRARIFTEVLPDSYK